MKNIIIIDIDTARTPVIKINKPDLLSPPTTPEEVKELILKDFECIAEGMLTLMHTSIVNGYETKEVLLEILQDKITTYINLNPTTSL